MSVIPTVVPMRFHRYYPGGKYSDTAAIDFLADAGFDGIDVSLENISIFEDMWELVTYSLASRARGRGLDLPLCHLPYAMPNPDDKTALRWFSRDVKTAIGAAGLMRIPYAVIHPIARHSSRFTKEKWFEENLAYLAPFAEYADKKGVKLLVENMAQHKKNDHLYGSFACEISELADKIGAGVCWDFGHANISGFEAGAGLDMIGDRLCAVHIHDNDGKRDEHLVPFNGNIDWELAMSRLSENGFRRFLDLEVKTSDLPNDIAVRMSFAQKTRDTASRLENLLMKEDRI